MGAAGREEGLQVDSDRSSVVIFVWFVDGTWEGSEGWGSRMTTMVALLISGVLMRELMFGICSCHV